MNHLTLVGMLDFLDQDELSEPEQIALRSAIIDKVDNCAMFEREMEDEVKRLRTTAKEFADAARASEKRLERFLNYVLFAMESTGFEKLPGERFECAVKDSPGKVQVTQEPTRWDAEAYPELVRIKYEWDKTAIKAGLAERDIPFARIVRERSAVFAIRKGKK